MKSYSELDSEAAVWGPYCNFDDIARFEYGRRMWLHPAMRERLIAHWTDPRHPYRERFAGRRARIEEVLASAETAVELDARLRAQGASLRCIAREIPPVFGSFWPPGLRDAPGQIVNGAQRELVCSGTRLSGTGRPDR